MLNLIGFLTTLFIGFTLINHVLGSALMTSADTAIVNNIAVFSNVSIFGLFSIPVPNLSFIFSGIPHLLHWDYSFFGGNAEVITYFFYAASAVVAVGFFLAIVGILFYKYGNMSR